MVTARAQSRSLPLGVALLVLTVASTIGAQEKVNRGRAVDREVSLRIFNLAGSVRVVGWARDSVAVTGTVAVGDRFMMGGTASGMKLGVESPPATSTGGRSELQVYVPADSRVWVKGGATTIVVAGVTGGLDLASVEGSVEVTGSPRELRVETMSGQVTIDGSPAWVRAKTATGRLTMRGGSDDAGLSTVSGALTVEGGRFGRGSFQSVSGDVSFGGRPDEMGSLAFDSHGGRIELRLPRDAGAEFDLRSLRGTIEDELFGRRPAPGRQGRGQQLGFVHRGGGTSIVATTFRGRILLRALPVPAAAR